MTTYFNNLNIEISHKEDIKPPELEDKSFYKVYSPEAFTLKPRDDICLDLKFKNDTRHTLTQIESWINLLPSLKQFDLRIENQDWCSNKLKYETLQLHILNRHFKRTVRIKKYQIIVNIFLLSEKINDKFYTKYTVIT